VSGPLSVNYTVTGADGVASVPESATLTVAPVAAVAGIINTSGSTTTANVPTPVGTGPFTYTLLDELGIDQGTVGMNPQTGKVTITSDPSFSGPATLHYTVTDGAGHASAPVDLDVTVLPVASDFRLPTVVVGPGGGSPATVSAQAPTPRGTGPFTYQLLGPVDPARGTATIDPATGVISFTPAPGTTGSTAIRYTVTDAHGLVSAPATATVVVQPAAVEPVDSVSPPTSPPAGAPAGASSTASTPSAPAAPIPGLLAFTGFNPALELVFAGMLTAVGAAMNTVDRRRRRRS
jgi:hypothetical protein